MPTPPDFKHEVVNSPDALDRCLAALSKAKVVAFDLETSGLDPHAEGASIYVIGACDGERSWVVPLDYPDSIWRRSQQGAVVDCLAKALSRASLVAHNGKFDCRWLSAKFGWMPHLSFDTMLAHHLLDENERHGLKPLAKSMYGADDYELPQPVDPKLVSLEKLSLYCALDCWYTWCLRRDFRPKIAEDEGLSRTFGRVVMPASRQLAKAELTGLHLDWPKLEAAEELIDQHVVTSQAALDEVAPKVNWASPKQVAKLLFVDLGLEPLDKTKTGQPSTSESVLERLKHPVVRRLLEHRALTKKKQFLKSWRAKAKDCTIRPNFLLHGTVTGRLSCRDPNLQQVPRDPFLRSLFTAPPGHVLIEADYSQVELRIAAMLAGERTMLGIFRIGGDIHAATAAKIMGIVAESVSAADRKRAKAVNFGFLYGMGAKKFQVYARDNYGVILDMSEAEAYREGFFDLFDCLPEWHEKQRRLARKLKRVRSPGGRLRRLPEIDSLDRFKRAEAERQAINAPVQAFASDLALLSFSRMAELVDGVRPVALIHDAVLAFAPEARAEQAAREIKAVMEDVVAIQDAFSWEMSVPLVVDVKIGPWGLGVKAC